MEELRSTEVLDKEIRAESVKKAEKILALILVEEVSMRIFPA